MLGFIGGTGPEGRGLALRFALSGDQVLIGSRDLQRAREAARSVLELAPSRSVEGALNADAALRSDAVFITVPYEAQRETLEALKEQLASKIVVEVGAPLTFINGRARAVPVEEGSASLQAQAILADSTVVAAFQTVSAYDLLDPEKSVDSDVVVCADDERAKAFVMKLATQIKGVRAIDGGGLEYARYVEDFAALLLNINRIYKVHSAIRIAGI